MTTVQELDRAITVLRFDESARNTLNEAVGVWVPVVAVRASRRDVSDGERSAAGTVGAYLQARFVVRSSVNTRGIVPSDMLRHEGKDWDIKGIKETSEGRHRFLEITASVSVD
ncbi:phage head completion protein [Mycoplana rhizolycopersici]|uniref:Head-tail adaptor protein n=1 Tax=Mycoplana rhizolycopersici TaxID=2746702 RepID=A0ABX2QGA4_9HYPH|nr:head-tail adaptor protein [Rhizobium rhizolycopersici]NVP55967.1 head-tail adaptor protein [Rhizobium rhizolycopersici]